MEMKRCRCGGRGEILEGQSAFNGYYEVRCRECGKRTAKHVQARDAVKDWNFMGVEDEQQGEQDRAGAEEAGEDSSGTVAGTGGTDPGVC